jgi:fructose-1-phosphate kinase PfkB-like protein
VTPNQQEAEHLLNTVLLTRSSAIAAARRIQTMGAQSVVLSLGSRGAIGATGTRIWEAIPPRIEAISPIGAGDAMAAAVLWAMENGDEFPQALSWGVAAGTASARLAGTQFATLEQARAVRHDLDLREIEA